MEQEIKVKCKTHIGQIYHGALLEERDVAFIISSSGVTIQIYKEDNGEYVNESLVCVNKKVAKKILELINED